jgi:protein MAK11
MVSERPTKKARLESANASIERKKTSATKRLTSTRKQRSSAPLSKTIPAQSALDYSTAPVSPTATSLPPQSLPQAFKLVAGSYEKLLYGIQGTVSTSNFRQSGFEIRLKPIFIFPAHVSCIKAAAASPSGGKWLATGSSDEIVKIWDLRKRKEVGGLMHHQG